MQLSLRGAQLSAISFTLIALYSCSSWPSGVGALQQDRPMGSRSLNPRSQKAFKPAWRVDLGERGPFLKGQSFIGGVETHPSRPLLAVVGYDGQLQLRHKLSGELLWTERLSASGAGAPHITGDTLLIPTSDAQLTAYSLQRREVLWRRQLSGLTTAPLKVRDGVVYATDGTDSLYALRLSDGEVLWQRRRGSPKDFSLNGEASPVLYKGVVYMGFSDGFLVAYDAASGSQLWERDLAPQRSQFQDVDADAVVIAGVLYAASSASGLYALDPRSGEPRWFHPVAGIISMTSQGEDLVVGLQHGEVGRFSPQDKRYVWRVSFGTDGAPSRVQRFPYGLAVSLSRGGLYILDAESGALRDQLSVGSGLLAPLKVSEAGWVYVSSLNGYLYALAPR